MRPPSPFRLGAPPNRTNPLAAIDIRTKQPPPFALGVRGVSPQGGAAALAPLEPPRSAGFLYERGLTEAALGAHAAAIATLRQATGLDPGLSEAWRKLGALLSLAGHGAEADAAYATGKACPPKGHLDASRNGALSPARLRKAEDKIRAMLEAARPRPPGIVLRQHLMNLPTDAAALRILSELGLAGGQFAEMESLLARALELAPDYPAARHNYAFVLLALGKPAESLAQLNYLLVHEPGNNHYRALKAAALAAVGDYGSAIEINQSLAKGATQTKPAFWLTYANALTYAGRRADAVRAYRKCLELAPTMGAAWWGLANLKDEEFSGGDLQAMQAALGSPGLASIDRTHLHYAVGRALEQSGNYADSFAHYAKGAALKRSEIGFDVGEWASNIRRSIGFFSAARIAEAAASGCQDAAPIFILGLPRSGSTLIEQILATHSAVEGTQELPEINSIVSDLAGLADLYPERLASLGARELAALGERFIERTRIYRRSDRPYFIDKMPSNWTYVGLIMMILPRAKIIDARRAPMASCFSTFKQLFATGAHYSYDLAELGRYYREYLGFMAHFDAVAPGRVHHVHYENMVDDTEAEIRRLLDYCGLPFEPACLRYWENKRGVGTPSSEQVRRPIFREGLDHWRNYEPWLSPLKQELERQGGC